MCIAIELLNSVVDSGLLSLSFFIANKSGANSAYSGLFRLIAQSNRRYLHGKMQCSGGELKRSTIYRLNYSLQRTCSACEIESEQ